MIEKREKLYSSLVLIVLAVVVLVFLVSEGNLVGKKSIHPFVGCDGPVFLSKLVGLGGLLDEELAVNIALDHGCYELVDGWSHRGSGCEAKGDFDCDGEYALSDLSWLVNIKL